MFLNQQQKNTLMIELDLIAEYLRYGIGPTADDPTRAEQAVARIKKMLTDQLNAPVAEPE